MEEESNPAEPIARQCFYCEPAIRPCQLNSQVIALFKVKHHSK